ncbi:phosphatase PAP2 family protein [Cellulomonas taurus]|uniref:phosphatase PAP2 family protein n=1 Tax=Cellulomonas taurus TaxID=2729175 RepID=UPI001FE39D06|nr:phosphatase PAP2 family protein [Cellulomonas taurus]
MTSVQTPPPAPVRTFGASRSTAVAWTVLVTLVAALGVIGCWRLFVATEHGQAVDQASLEGAHIGQGRLWQVAEPVLDVVSVGFIVGAVLFCGAIALIRRRWSLAIAATLVLGGANLSTQFLKKMVWDRPDWGHGPDFNTLPSGHTTAAASVAVAVLLVVPPRARAWVAVLGAGYAGATGISTLVGQWHRPSDVIAAVLVVLAWGALACLVPAVGSRDQRGTPTAAVPTVTRRPVGRTADRVAIVLLLLVALAAGVAGGLGLISTWNSADPLADRTSLLTAYGGGALGIVAVTALAFAVLTAVRRSAVASGLRDGPS